MTATSIPAELRRNFKSLYADIFWFGVLSGSTLSFLAIYTARIGASAFQVSLLTAGPAVINLLFSLPAGHWLERQAARKQCRGENPGLVPAAFWSALLQRLGYLAIVPLPWFLSRHLQVWAIALVILAISIPGTVLAISFNAMFADVVPPQWRSEVVGRRNALLSVSQAGIALLSGQILVHLSEPANYQVVFALGAAGAMLSTYYVGRIRMPGSQSLRVWQSMQDIARPGLLVSRLGDARRVAAGMRFLARSGDGRLLRLELLRGRFGLFILAYLVFYSTQFLPVSLFPMSFVRVLNLSDADISIGNGLLFGAMLLISLRLGAMGKHFGHKRLLVASALLYGLYPLIIGLATNTGMFWAASIIGGFVWGVCGAALVNRLMEVVPEEDRPAGMAIHNLALNIGILLGSFSGPLLGEWLGIPHALIMAGVARAAAGLLLIFLA